MPSLMAFLGLDGSGYKAGLDKAKKHAHDAGGEISSALGHHLKAALSFAVVEELARKTMEYAGKVTDLSERLGISTDAVQEWDYALTMSGATLEQFAPFFERISAARYKALKGNKESIEAFRQLGVAIDDLKNKRVEDIALSIARTFQEGDPEKLVAALRTVGGRNAGEFIPAFKKGLADLIDDAHQLGMVIDADVIARLHEVENTVSRIGKSFITGFAPVLSGLSKGAEWLWEFGNGYVNFLIGILSVPWYRPWDAIQNGLAQSRDYWKELEERKKAMEERERKMRERSKYGGAFGEAEDPQGEKAAESRARRILQLKEQLFEKQQDSDLKALDTQKQIELLLLRRKALIYATNSFDEEGALRAKLDLEEVNQKLLDITKPGGGKAKHFNNDVTANQKIGAWAPFPSIDKESLTVAQKSEKHLDEMKKDVRKLLEKQQPSTGVKY